MKKDDIYYGFEGDEQLSEDMESLIEQFFEDNCEQVGEGSAAIADRIAWPIVIGVYRRFDLAGEGHAIPGRVLEEVLERLDEEYGDPDGDPFDATAKMWEAANAFACAVLDEYVPWMCEPTGEVIAVTRNEALEIVGP